MNKNREYYRKNKETLDTKHREYYRKNKETLATKHREYYKRNKDRLIAKQREYYKKNKEKIMAKNKMNDENKKRCRRCGRILRTKISKVNGFCVVCSPPEAWGIVGNAQSKNGYIENIFE